jgi:endonuclease/exonuclease/phosphatase family metal-dependent hydrolase
MRLRIVTYNIHKGVGRDFRCRLDRIAGVLADYEPDVVALQEAFRFHAHYDLPSQPAELSEKLGLPHVVTAWNVPRRRGVYGNATLSRLPILDDENICLKWRFKKARSALYSRVKLPAGGDLHLFNVHLGLAHFERKIQMRRVTEWTQRLSRGHEPVVIAGDTNDWMSRLPRLHLAENGFRCSGHGQPHAHRHTYPAILPMGALDRVYLRGAVRVVASFSARTSLARRASDHLPLVTDLEIELP